MNDINAGMFILLIFIAVIYCVLFELVGYYKFKRKATKKDKKKLFELNIKKS